MPRWLSAWVGTVVRHAPVVALATVAVTAALAVYTARNLGVNTDTADMIARDLPWRQDFIRYREAFPRRLENIVVVIDEGTAAAREAAAAAMLAHVRGTPGLYASGFAPGTGSEFEGRELLYLDLEELESLVDSLVAAQPLLGRLRADYSAAGLFSTVAEALEAGEPALVSPLLEPLAGTLAAARRGGQRPLDWRSLLFDGGDGLTGERQFVVVAPRMDYSRLRPAQEPMQALRDRGAEIGQAEEVRIRLTGSVALEDEEFVGVMADTSRAGLLVLAAVVAVLWLALRSVRVLLAALITLASGLVATAAFSAWAVGELNLISVAFAVLYIGLGIDFIIHYALRVAELSAGGTALTEALARSGADVGSSLVFCALTTAAAFYAFIPTPFVGVSQLGLISGTGMLISLAASLTVLPAWLRLFFGSRMPAPHAAGGWQAGRLLGRLTGRRRLVLGTAALVSVAAVVAAPRAGFDEDPMKLRDPDAESVQVYRELSRDPDTAPRTLSVVLGPDADVGATAARLRALPTVARVLSLESFVPDRQPQKLALLDDASLLFGPGFHRFPPREAPQPERLAAALERVHEALGSAGGGAGTAVTVDPAAAAARDASADLAGEAGWLRSALAAGTLSASDLDRLAAQLLGGLPPALSRLAQALRAEPFGVQDLPASLRERWRGRNGERLLEVLPAGDMTDAQAAAAFVGEVRAAAPAATGLAVVYQEAGETVVAAFREASVYAAAAVLLLLAVFLRTAAGVGLVIVPVVLALLCTIALAAVLGVPFNFANIIALPLLLGLGVDNGIHIVHRARLVAGGRALLATSTARAVFYSSVTTLASFAGLAVSAHRGMSGMGLVLALGLFGILFYSMIALPALLAGRRP